MIKKIDANKYGVVRYAISSIEDIADLPREVSVGSEAILVNEDGEKKFRLGSDGWVEVVEVKEYDEDKLRDILEDAKVGYGGIEYETLEERLDKDFDNVYSVLDNRTYIEYEGCRITAKDSLNGLQKETVIKGRTLQNLVSMAKLYSNNDAFDGSAFKNQVFATKKVSWDYNLTARNDILKLGSTYTVIINYNKGDYTGTASLRYSSSGKLKPDGTINFNESKRCVYTVTIDEERMSHTAFLHFKGSNPAEHSGYFSFTLMILEGDHTQTPIEELPFIEGIESVGDKSKNLFDYNKLTYGYYFNPTTGEYMANHVSCTTGYIKFNKCNITISGLYNQTSSYVGYYDINYNYIGRSAGNPVTEHKLTVGSVIADSSYKGHVVPANAEYIALNIYRNLAVNPDVTIEMIKENIKQVQIEEDSQVTAYEPYYDGYKVSGKSCGKNLLNLEDWFNRCFSGIRAKTESVDATHYKLNKDGLIVKNGSDYTSWTNILTEKFLYLKKGKYTVSFVSDTLISIQISVGLNVYGYYQGIGHCFISFETLNDNYFNFKFYEVEEEEAIVSQFQLYEGHELIPYEPYKETTYSYILGEPLRSLPDGVCDEIDLEKGVVTRRVGKYTFTGDETTFGEATEVTGDVTTTYLTIHDRAKGKVDNIICNSLACYPYTVYEDIQGILVSSFSCFVLSFKNGTLKSNDIEGVKQWLKDNPTTVYYELANPTTEYLIKGDKFVTLPNGVKDEAGRIVTRNVGKIVLNGSEDWKRLSPLGSTDTIVFEIHLPNSKPSDNNKIEIMCDTLTVYKANDLWYYEGADNICSHNETNGYQIRINKNELGESTVEEFRKWLSRNPVTVYYQLETPYIECSYEEHPTLPNGVKDEVSYNSVLRRVGKFVVDGSQVLTRSSTNSNKTKTTHFSVNGISSNSPYGICDKLPTVIDAALQVYEEPCMKFSSPDKINPPYALWLNIDRSNADTVEEAYEYFRNNPHTVWYELRTPYIEPINLDEVILDTIRLKSYEPITHITSDNYLLPTIKTQVPSDFNAVVLGLKSNNEALASQVMSLRQTNDELEVTNREQDDVIDVTLLALDEVYGMIDEGEIETMSIGSPMVNVYVKMIKRGIKTLDEVPAKYRAEVEELI